MKSTMKKEPAVIRTEDGYKFYRLKDGRYADNININNADMIYNSLKDISDVTSFKDVTPKNIEL